MTSIITNSTGGLGVETAVRLLRAGRSALDAIEQGIWPVELDPECHSVGRGGWPNLLGEVELDAAIMDGQTLNSGAVGAVRGFLQPISVARQVMDELPHVMLVGTGAERFAAEMGAVAGENLTDVAQARHEEWLKEIVPAEARQSWPDAPMARASWGAADPEKAKGTTVFLVRDAAGHIAVGTSTSGWAWKYPGRLGDSPVVGAGLYADDRHGAAACTGHGELTIRSGTARAVVLYQKMGMTLDEALLEACRDLDALTTRFAGSVTLFGMDREGRVATRRWGTSHGDHAWVWDDAMDAPGRIEPVVHVR